LQQLFVGFFRIGDQHQLAGQIGQSADRLDGLRQILQGAECRLMCAFAARVLDEK
jgi:hypothetical protein